LVAAGRFLLLAFAFCALAACERAPVGANSGVKFNAIDITGADYAKDFALTGHDGKPRTLADFKGKVVLFFFGFTNCPDYCPTALASYKKVLQLLGSDASRVQLVFFTLDPERDTPDVLKQYVTGFDPSFLGLYTDVAATAKTAQSFRIFFEKQAVDAGTGAYNVDHTVGTYVFDPQGRLRLFFSSGMAPEKIVQDVRNLLSS
jgi:protein SCO1/2